MTSSNGNIFRVTGPLCGEFTGPGDFPAQTPVTRSFDVFFDLRLNKRLSKQPWGWWFETPAWSYDVIMSSTNLTWWDCWCELILNSSQNRLRLSNCMWKYISLVCLFVVTMLYLNLFSCCNNSCYVHLVTRSCDVIYVMYCILNILL